MASDPSLTNKDYALLANKSRYWDWFTRDIDNADILKLLNHIETKHGLPVNTAETRIALWEYGDGDELPPHIDPDISLSSSVIVSLVGRFETRVHDKTNLNVVLDKVSYGPGDYIILNNTVHYHSGKPLDNYRLAVVAFVDPSYDMTEFWS